MSADQREAEKIRSAIEKHRKELHRLFASQHSLTHPQVVQISQAIDQLLNQLNRLQLKQASHKKGN